LAEHYLCIAGAQRCGTTYLYKVLDAHPQIAMAKPVRPEPKFFLSEEYSSGKEFYRAKYFSNLEAGVTTIGEKGTSYLEYPEVAKKVRAFFPDSKLLVILRNPVRRALSNYYFSKENGLETRSLEDVFLRDAPPPQVSVKTSVSPFNYLGRGEYDRYLPPFMEEFGENMRVLIFEEFAGNPDAIRNLYNFIGVEPSFMPANITERVNSGPSYEHAVPGEITRKLASYYGPAVKRTEQLLNREIPSWHDTI
jgi:hypothetical protein